MFYELATPTWGPEERDAILRTIGAGRTTMGEEVAAFEAAFAAYNGKRFAVMVNSGSSANLIAIASLFYRRERPIQRGDEVLVPAISWATTYHPLHQHGLKLRILDVELDTLNMDVSVLERALTPRTRAVMAVSILGNPAALDVLRSFCKRHRLYFIEDNCESLDGELNGRKTGTFGDIGTFSLFFSSHLDRRRRRRADRRRRGIPPLEILACARLDARSPAGLAAIRAARGRLHRIIPLHPARL